MGSIVIIPTYNEIENIENIIRKVFSLPENIHVLIVDDGSPDGTALKVKELQDTFKDKLFLLERSGKLGLGTAYILGFKWCLEHGYDYVFEMDADFSHNPDDLINLLAACRDEGFDTAVGSRYKTGVNVVNWPLGRILMSYGASIYVRLILGMPIMDPTGGFVCYTAQVLRSLDLDKIQFIGYAFQIEMKYNIYRKGFKIKEVPIIFTDRIAGQSKMSVSIFKEAILGVIKMRLDSLFGR